MKCQFHYLYKNARISIPAKIMTALITASCAAPPLSSVRGSINSDTPQSAAFLPPPVAEGGATSGGGELVADAHNPWFLQNTPVVKYCITSSGDFGWDDDQGTKVDAAFRSAVAYWKEQMKLAEPYQKHRLPDGSKITLGGQKFERTGCNDNMVDLTLTLGVLNDQQLAFVKDPSRFAAITVRTNYDPEVLRGRGFIYISPDRGPRAFKGLNLVDNAWTLGEQNNLLRLTFIHELGHVFGVQHNDNESLNLMSSKFVESILHRNNYQNYLTVDKPDWLIQNYQDPNSMMNAGFITCLKGELTAPIVKFLGINLADGKCLRFDPYNDGENPHRLYGFLIWQSTGTGADVRHLGSVLTELSDKSKIRVSNRIVSELYLTDRQKIIPLPITVPRTIPILESSVFKFTGSLFKLYGGMEQTASLLSIEPDRIRITAAVENTIYEDIFGAYAFTQKKIMK